MQEDTRAQIDKLLGKAVASKQAQAVAQDTAAERAKAALEDFKRISRDVIRPCMVEFGEVLKAKGFGYRITEKDEQKRYEPNGPIMPAEISLLLLLDGDGQLLESTPRLTVGCVQTDAKVYFNRSTVRPGRGGQSGSCGNALLAEVTSELIQRHLINVLGEAVK